MTLIQNPIIGAARKQSGGMVFSRANGQNIMRAKPFNVNMKHNKNRDKQKVKFKAGGELAAKVKSFCKDLYPTNKPGRTAYSSFFRDLLNCIVFDGDNISFSAYDKYFSSGTKRIKLAPLTAIPLDHLLQCSLSLWASYFTSIFGAYVPGTKISVLLTSVDCSECAIIEPVFDLVNDLIKFNIPVNLHGKLFFISDMFITPSSIYGPTKCYFTTDSTPYQVLA